MMASLMHSLQDNYKDWQIGYSPEIDKWFLMDSPGTMLMILLAYLLFVLKIGPAIMKNRPPIELRKTMIYYNGIQVIFSAVLVWMAFRIDIPYSSMFSTACAQKTERTPRNESILYEGIWWYHFAKVTELTDTVIFVLRKKNNQVSFLHVYHHTVMVLFTWLCLKYAPAEQGAIIGILNSSVHVIMYFYYMIAAMGPQYQKYIWWKKYMTTIQLVQFCIVIVYLTLLSFSKCSYSQFASYFFIINAFVFLFMFLNFYRNTYNNKKPKSMPNGTTYKLNDESSIKSTNKGFVDDNEVYSRITKDVEILDRSAKLNKMKAK